MSFPVVCVEFMNNSQCLILQRNFMLMSGKVLSCEKKEETLKMMENLLSFKECNDRMSFIWLSIHDVFLVRQKMTEVSL